MVLTLLILVGLLTAGLTAQTVRVRRLKALLPKPEVNVIEGIVLPVVDDPRWVVGKTKDKVIINDCFVLDGSDIYVRKITEHARALAIFAGDDPIVCVEHILSINGQNTTGNVVKPYFEEVRRSFLQRKALEGIAGE